jgi:hypothetical protein
MVHTYGGFLLEVDFLPGEVILRPSELSLGILEHVTYIGPSLQGNRSTENPSPRRSTEYESRKPSFANPLCRAKPRRRWIAASTRLCQTWRGAYLLAALSKKTPRCS